MSSSSINSSIMRQKSRNEFKIIEETQQTSKASKKLNVEEKKKNTSNAENKSNPHVVNTTRIKIGAKQWITIASSALLTLTAVTNKCVRSVKITPR